MNEDLNVSAHHHQLPREPQQTVTVSSCFTLETAVGQKSDGHSHYPAITNEGSDGHPYKRGLKPATTHCDNVSAKPVVAGFSPRSHLTRALRFTQASSQSGFGSQMVLR